MDLSYFSSSQKENAAVAAPHFIKEYRMDHTSVGIPHINFAETPKANQPIDLHAEQRPTNIDSVLTERGSRYGKYTGHAKITQDLKALMHATGNWSKLAPDQKESLEMVAHKIGRILNGDPNYDDSWVDIAGYAQLVATRLKTGVEK